MKQLMRRPLAIIFYLGVITYPLLVHLDLIQSSSIPVLLTLLVIVVAMMIRQRLTAVILTTLLVTTALLFEQGQLADLYILPPIVINFFIGMIFTTSLNRHSTPVIEKYIVLLEGGIDAAEKRYARWVTICWAGLLLGLTVESVLVGLFASHETWSFVTSFINYGLLALMFLGEYLVRRKVLPHKQHMSFIQFINRLRKIKLKAVVM